MGKPNIKYWDWGLLVLVISPIIVTFSAWQLAKAQLTPELISVEFPPVERPPSSGTTGGGSRGYCRAITGEKKELIALMPTDNAGTTISTNPKFFLYVPEHKAKLAEFEIKDKSGKSLYSTELDISTTSGIVKLTLPENVNLQTNKEYTWTFAIVCDPLDRVTDNLVQGTIKKVEISSELENSLKNATLLEQAKIYAKAKIWHDTIATVADLRTSNPKEWEELLRSIQLEEIASEPFAACCQVEE
ncbi:MAG: DUF928 domain-containing protein [Trichodesmium sp. MAG_R01]|nr:DUF928 domain-containing protein [Trichodesmium sp. MAG_R01]